MRERPNILIEINTKRDLRNKDRRDICRLLAESNAVIAESNDVLVASDGKMTMYSR